MNTDIAKEFLSPRAEGYYMPAEWSLRDGTLMAWPVRTEAWLDGLAEARDGFVEVANAIAEYEPLTMIVRPRPDGESCDAITEARKRLASSIEIWELPHDDSWIRDNGPTFLLNANGDRCAVNWRFNAWGEKYHPYDADDRLASLILERLGIRKFDAPFILEGGSIHVDGMGTLLTTEECLLAKNRNPALSKSDIEGLLRAYLGVDTFVWLDRGLAGDETDGHVDNLACFVKPGLVAMQVAIDPDDPNYANSEANLLRLRAAKDATGKKIEIVKIEQPPTRLCRQERLTLSYINYYPVSGGLIVPIFASAGGADMKRADERALGVLRDLYPDRKIVPIDGMKIIKGGGNVHCVTQQIPAAGRRS